MACMTYECPDCDYWESDNKDHHIRMCPRHGIKLIATFDEPDERDYDEREEPDEQQED
jgi:hypothetical protein